MAYQVLADLITIGGDKGWVITASTSLFLSIQGWADAHDSLKEAMMDGRQWCLVPVPFEGKNTQGTGQDGGIGQVGCACLIGI